MPNLDYVHQGTAGSLYLTVGEHALLRYYRTQPTTHVGGLDVLSGVWPDRVARLIELGLIERAPEGGCGLTALGVTVQSVTP